MGTDEGQISGVIFPYKTNTSITAIQNRYFTLKILKQRTLKEKSSKIK